MVRLSRGITFILGWNIKMIELSKRECELLLKMFKSNQFNGSDLELIYDLVVKIQNIYKQIDE